MRLLDSNNIQDIILGIITGEYEKYSFPTDTELYCRDYCISRVHITGVVIYNSDLYFVVGTAEKGNFIAKCRKNCEYKRYFSGDKILYTDETLKL